MKRRLDTAFAFVSLIDKDRQWFKSASGVDLKETSLDASFCAHAIWSDKPFIVLNTLEDERFRENPYVAGEPHIRFYAGMPLVTKNGNKIGTLCVSDNKPRKEMSDNELDLIVTLSKLVIDEIELHSANVKLKEKSDAKSIFLANMSHEIRTPMNGVIGMANLLGNTNLTKKQLSYVETIIESGDSLMSIINDILDISKIEAGGMEIDSHLFDLFSTLESIQKLFSSRVKEKNIKLKFYYDKDLPRYFLGDSGRIRQIVTNLISNAVKFTEKGAVTVEVKLSKNKK